MRDPHCGRSAHERIGFAVRGQSWDVEWGSCEVCGTPAFWVNRTATERIVVSLAQLRSEPPPGDPIELEIYLGRLYGVGPPTAARIVRNLTGSAKVAIISGPLVRALTWTGIFKPQWHLRRHYDRFRESFLQYADHGNVQPGALDLCIWEKTRSVEPSHFDLGYRE